MTYTHYRELLLLHDKNEIDYYIEISIKNNLSVRQLKHKIKSKEYERLPEETKKKLIIKEETNVEDLIKNPIIINNKNNYEIISEKI